MKPSPIFIVWVINANPEFILYKCKKYGVVGNLVDVTAVSGVEVGVDGDGAKIESAVGVRDRVIWFRHLDFY